MPSTKTKKKLGRPAGSKNKVKKVKTNTPVKAKKKLGRPTGSKNKTTEAIPDPPVLEKVISDSTPNLFTINEHELFNVISSYDNQITHTPPSGTLFGLMVEGTKNGKIYFSLAQIKKGR